MATKKMLKYGKKPKANASVSAMENYLTKCKEIDKKNAAIKSVNAKAAGLKKKISSLKQKV